jgi:pimeloyl-ACP methyl ester carboxylesterase
LVERKLASLQPAKGVLVALAGGPGQAAVPLTDTFASQLASGLRTRDLVVFDQRGTGQSGFLNCPTLNGLSGSSDVPRAVATCANSLGPARDFYTTRDSLEDIEALRQALGVDRIALYGASYGTRVALAYAWRYPQHVELLVLDSVVPLAADDPLNLSGYAAYRRVLRDMCAIGCGSITHSPVGDVARLAKRWGRRPLHTTVTTLGGRRERVTLTPLTLLSLVQAAADDPILRAELPADVGSTLGGETLLMRRAVGRLNTGGGSGGTDYSSAVNLATICEEASFPWQRGVPPDVRYAETQSAISATPESAFSPFGRRTVLATFGPQQCRFWPQSAQPPTVNGGPFPAVPALLLAGVDDTITPLEDAQAVASQLPDARLLAVPDTGHSVLASDLSGCAERQLARFFAGEAIRNCPRTRYFLPAPVPPMSLSRIRKLPPGVHGNVGRTLMAVLWSLQDTYRSAIDAEVHGVSSAGHGLRGGVFGGTPRNLRFTRIVYVPGVSIAGRITPNTTTVTVSGSAAAHGSLRIRGPLITGQLGGERLSEVYIDAVSASGAGWP